MSAFRCLLLLIIGVASLSLISIPVVYSHSDGAPDGVNPAYPGENACADLVPAGHGVGFTAGDGGYTISVSSSTLNSLVPVTVTLSAPSGQYIKGHLLTAFNSSASQPNANQPLGTWQITDTRLSKPVCPSALDSTLRTAITHTAAASSSNNFNGVPNLSFQYTPPSSPAFGSITFNVTIVKEFTTFYRLSTIIPEKAGVLPSPPSNLRAIDGSIVAGGASNNITFSYTLGPPGSMPIQYYFIDCDMGTSSKNFTRVFQGLDTNPQVSGIPSGQTVGLRIGAHSQLGDSGFSPLYTITTAATSDTKPVAPINVRATGITSTGFNIEWDNGNGGGGLPILRYQLDQSSDDGTTWKTIYQGSNPYFNLTNLPIATSYSFRAYSKSLAGLSNPSATFSITTGGCPGNCSGVGTCDPIKVKCVCPSNYLNANCSLKADGPPRCFGPSSLCIQWKVADDSVYVRLAIKQTSGWYAISVGATDGMTGANVFRLSWSSTAGALITSLHASGFTTPVSDVIQSFDTTTLTGFVNNSWTDIIFARKLRTSNPSDYILPSQAGVYVPVSWAYGTSPFNQHDRNARGRWKVDFVGGNLIEIGAVEYGTMYIPIIAAIVAIVVFGLVFQTPCCRKSFCARRVSSTWSLPNAFDFVTFNVRQSIQDLTVMELCALVVWGALVALFIGLGTKAFSDNSKSQIYIVGHLNAILLTFGLMPVSRNSILSYIFASSFERWLKYHRWIMRSVIVCVWIHMFTMLQFWGYEKFTDTATLPYGDNVYSGFIAFLALNVIAVLAYEPVRRKYFEIFYYSHLLLWPVAITFAMIHSTFFRFYIILPVALYLIDRSIRFVRSRRNVNILNVQVLHAGSKCMTMIQLQIDNFKFTPGQYVFVQVPGISWYEWHPFSISSAPSAPGAPFTLHCMDMGYNTFTANLGEFLGVYTSSSRSRNRNLVSGNKATESTDSKLVINIDGPHGHIPFKFEDYNAVVLIGGGVGITPLMSIASYLLSTQSSQYPNIKAIHLIWVVRNPMAISKWFPHQLQAFLKHPDLVHLHLYCTGDDLTKQAHEKQTPRLVNVGGSGAGTGDQDEIVVNNDSNRFREEHPEAAEKATIDMELPAMSSTSLQQSAPATAGSDEAQKQIDHARNDASPSPPALSSTPDERTPALSEREASGSRTREAVGVSVEPGRPDLKALLSTIRRKHAGIEGNEFAVHVCGPLEMMASGHQAAMENGMTVSKETFLL